MKNDKKHALPNIYYIATAIAIACLVILFYGTQFLNRIIIAIFNISFFTQEQIHDCFKTISLVAIVTLICPLLACGIFHDIFKNISEKTKSEDSP